MPKIPISLIVSFSSQCPKNPLENITANKTGKKWLSSPTDKSGKLWAILQLPKPTKITNLDIGTFFAFSVEVLVGKSTWAQTEEYRTLVPMLTLMTPTNCRMSTNTVSMQMLKYDKFDSSTRDQEWDRIKIVLSQPFRRDKQFGLSTLVVTSTGANADENGIDTSSFSERTLLTPSRNIRNSFPQSDKKRDLRTEKVKADLLKISGSAENGSSHEASLSRAAQLIIASAGRTPKYKTQEAIGVKPLTTGERRKAKIPFEKELEAFHNSLNLSTLSLEETKYSDLRHKFEKLIWRKLSKEEKKVFREKTADFINDMVSCGKLREQSAKRNIESAEQVVPPLKSPQPTRLPNKAITNTNMPSVTQQIPSQKKSLSTTTMSGISATKSASVKQATLTEPCTTSGQPGQPLFYQEVGVSDSSTHVPSSGSREDTPLPFNFQAPKNTSQTRSTPSQAKPSRKQRSHALSSASPYNPAERNKSLTTDYKLEIKKLSTTDSFQRYHDSLPTNSGNTTDGLLDESQDAKLSNGLGASHSFVTHLDPPTKTGKGRITKRAQIPSVEKSTASKVKTKTSTKKSNGSTGAKKKKGKKRKTSLDDLSQNWSPVKDVGEEDWKNAKSRKDRAKLISQMRRTLALSENSQNSTSESVSPSPAPPKKRVRLRVSEKNEHQLTSTPAQTRVRSNIPDLGSPLLSQAPAGSGKKGNRINDVQVSSGAHKSDTGSSWLLELSATDDESEEVLPEIDMCRQPYRNSSSVVSPMAGPSCSIPLVSREKVRCPICSEMFSEEVIEIHTATCGDQEDDDDLPAACPICCNTFSPEYINIHVNECIDSKS